MFMGLRFSRFAKHGALMGWRASVRWHTLVEQAPALALPSYSCARCRPLAACFTLAHHVQVAAEGRQAAQEAAA
jgi:hypothetical protein